jgi:glycosyltransferase involved in cell wall biosynthesis
MIDILLATYNGEAFLRQQLDSIINQDFSDWRLLIRDDVSSDNTANILSEYAQKHPDRIKVIDNNGLNLGARQNFAELLRIAESDLMMICDQDDIWLPDKISITLNKMKELQGNFGNIVPLLVHTNFKIINADLDVLAESGWKYLNIDPGKAGSLNRLLVNNTQTGCTIMLNRPLRDIALPIPQEAVMHDWWLALVAAVFGRSGLIGRPTMLYRQHGENVSGNKKKWGLTHVFRQLHELPFHRRELQRFRKQAEAFLRKYRDNLNADQEKLIETYSMLDKYNCLLRRYYIIKHRLFFCGLSRNIGWLIVC